MSFIVDNLSSLGAFGPDATLAFTYSHPTDTLEEIKSDSYFDIQKFTLLINTIILIKSSDETTIIYVTQNLPTVKTTFFLDTAGPLHFKGDWNATTNTPTLTSGVGSEGAVYIVTVAGSTNLDGITDWEVGNWAVFNGDVWKKIDSNDFITGVNGTNLTVVSGILNTIQDIDETATPKFGRLNIDGISDTLNFDGVSAPTKLLIQQTTGQRDIAAVSYGGTVSECFFAAGRGTAASPAIILANQRMGHINWFGYDGSTFRGAAKITSQVEGTPGPNDMPGDMQFFTRPVGGSAPISRMRISQSGSIGIGTGFPDVDSLLEVASTTKGVRFCPMTEVERDAIPTPPEGLEIFNLTSHKKNFFNGTIWTESDDLPVFTVAAVPFGAADGTLAEDASNFTFDDSKDQLAIGAPNTSITINTETRNGSLLAVSNGVPEKWGLISQAFGTTTNAVLTMTRARGSQAAPAASNSGDMIGAICYAGYDGTDYGLSGEISTVASANHTNNNTPADMEFKITATGAAVPTLALTIKSDKSLLVDKSISINTTTTTLNLNSSAVAINYLVENEGATAVVDFVGIQHGLSETVGFFGAKSDGTKAAPTVPADTSTMVQMAGLGWDGTTYRPGALIQMQIDGVAGASDMPGKIIFSTTPDGSITPNSALVIDSAQVATFDIGIKLPSGISTPSLLDFYATETFSMSFDSTIFSTPLVVTLRLIRTGGQVTITWPRATKSMSGGSADATIITNVSYHIPAAYRPSDNDIQFVLNGLNDGVITQLQGIITTTGQIRIGIAPNELNNFTFNGANSAGFYESSMTYFGEAT